MQLSLATLVTAATLAAALTPTTAIAQAWTQATSATNPGVLVYHAMVYDALRAETVLFGGWDGGVVNADTWAWNGVNWTQKTPVNQPGPRYSHQMAYNSSNGKTYLFGGRDPATLELSDFWEWDGNDWTQIVSANTPPQRAFHAMAYDSVRDRIVLHGGYGNFTNLSDTWEWDGTDWVGVPGTGPSIRAHTMIYHEELHACFLYGGVDLTGSTQDKMFRWDGANWILLPSSGSHRAGHGVAYDTSRNKMIVYGGHFSPPYQPTDVREWDTTNGFLPTFATGPQTYLGNFGMVFDSARRKSVMYGGVSGGVINSETWEYDASDPGRSIGVYTEHVIYSENFDAWPSSGIQLGYQTQGIATTLTARVDGVNTSEALSLTSATAQLSDPGVSLWTSSIQLPLPPGTEAILEADLMWDTELLRISFTDDGNYTTPNVQTFNTVVQPGSYARGKIRIKTTTAGPLWTVQLAVADPTPGGRVWIDNVKVFVQQPDPTSGSVFGFKPTGSPSPANGVKPSGPFVHGFNEGLVFQECFYPAGLFAAAMSLNLAAAPLTVPGIAGEFWLDPLTMVIAGHGTAGVGAAQVPAGGFVIPPNPAFLGVPTWWQGMYFNLLQPPTFTPPFKAYVVDTMY